MLLLVCLFIQELGFLVCPFARGYASKTLAAPQLNSSLGKELGET